MSNTKQILEGSQTVSKYKDHSKECIAAERDELFISIDPLQLTDTDYKRLKELGFFIENEYLSVLFE